MHTIKTASGQTSQHHTLAAAIEAADARGWVVGDWDGQRALCWESEEDSENDAGAKAVAEIVEAPTQPVPREGRAWGA